MEQNEKDLEAKLEAKQLVEVELLNKQALRLLKEKKQEIELVMLEAKTLRDINSQKEDEHANLIAQKLKNAVASYKIDRLKITKRLDEIKSNLVHIEKESEEVLEAIRSFRNAYAQRQYEIQKANEKIEALIHAEIRLINDLFKNVLANRDFERAKIGLTTKPNFSKSKYASWIKANTAATLTYDEVNLKYVTLFSECKSSWKILLENALKAQEVNDADIEKTAEETKTQIDFSQQVSVQNINQKTELPANTRKIRRVRLLKIDADTLLAIVRYYIENTKNVELAYFDKFCQFLVDEGCPAIQNIEYYDEIKTVFK